MPPEPGRRAGVGLGAAAGGAGAAGGAECVAGGAECGGADDAAPPVRSVIWSLASIQARFTPVLRGVAVVLGRLPLVLLLSPGR